MAVAGIRPVTAAVGGLYPTWLLTMRFRQQLCNTRRVTAVDLRIRGSLPRRWSFCALHSVVALFLRFEKRPLEVVGVQAGIECGAREFGRNGKSIGQWHAVERLL